MAIPAKLIEKFLTQFIREYCKFLVYLSFVKVGRTIPISLTGTHCGLMCSHCNAEYLKGMLTKEQALKLIKGKPHYYTSALISGGSTAEGKVPIMQHLRFIKKLKQMGLKLNYVDRLSFDFIYDDDVIHNVYHLLSKSKEDYEKTYLLIRRVLGGKIHDVPYGSPSTKTVPHFTIGLNGGVE